MKPHRITVPPVRNEQSSRLSDTVIGVARVLLTFTVVLTLGVGATNPAHAQILTGNGTNLPIPTAGNTFATFPGVAATYVDNTGTFTGTWSSTAQAAWVGNFTVTGPLPAGTVSTGTSTYNFTTLTTGFLPANSYFVLSDLDNGSGTGEQITLKAYTGATAATVITSEWLNSPTLIYASTGSGGGGAAVLTDMPGWDWNITTGSTYTFNGTTVAGNPNINLAIFSSQNIGYLEVTRNNTFSHFGPGAQSAIPEPSTYAAMAGAAMLGFAVWRRRSRNNLSAVAPSAASA